MANINKISNDSFAFTTIIVKGTGNIHAANNVPKTNFFRFTFGYLILQQDTQIKAMTEMAKTVRKDALLSKWFCT